MKRPATVLRKRGLGSWGLVAMLAATTLIATACGSSNGNKKTETQGSTAPATTVPVFPAGTTMAALQQKGKIVVGTKFDQPGLGLKNPTTNQPEGFDVEIAKLIAVGIFGGSTSNLGNKIQFVESTTPNREAFIQNGTVDIVVATYTINDTRKQQVDFAGPYYLAGQDIMVKVGDNSIKGVNDLNGKKVCSVRNSTPAANIQAKAPQADLTLFDQYSDCVQAMRDGRVQAVSTDNSILLGFVNSSPNEFKLVGNKFTDEPYGIGLKKGDTAFRTFINDRLEAIYRSGEWARAFAATLGKFGIPTPTPPPVDRY
jgi:glutamate transport system substrate-binding protein